jgi:hypothetical protein
MRIMTRILVGIAPLLLTLLFAWLTMEGYLNLGAGCKDIFLAVPMLMWSLAFLVCCTAFWWRGISFRRLIVRSFALATGLVLVAWAVLFAFSLFI